MQTIFDAIAAGDVERVEELAAADPEVSSRRDDAGVSALMQARYRGPGPIVEALLAQGADLDVFEAATFGRLDRLRELLDQEPSGAQAFAADGFPALHFAAFFGQPEAARLLLDRGADENAVARNPMRVQPIHSAAAASDAEIVGLLLAAGADANARQQGGFTPIHAAAQNGDEATARLLLEHGADPEARTDAGRNAVELAQDAGHAAVVNLLQAGV